MTIVGRSSDRPPSSWRRRLPPAAREVREDFEVGRVTDRRRLARVADPCGERQRTPSRGDVALDADEPTFRCLDRVLAIALIDELELLVFADGALELEWIPVGATIPRVASTSPSRPERPPVCCSTRKEKVGAFFDEIWTAPVYEPEPGGRTEEKVKSVPSFGTVERLAGVVVPPRGDAYRKSPSSDRSCKAIVARSTTSRNLSVAPRVGDVPACGNGPRGTPW